MIHPFILTMCVCVFFKRPRHRRHPTTCALTKSMAERTPLLHGGYSRPVFCFLSVPSHVALTLHLTPASIVLFFATTTAGFSVASPPTSAFVGAGALVVAFGAAVGAFVVAAGVFVVAFGAVVVVAGVLVSASPAVALPPVPARGTQFSKCDNRRNAIVSKAAQH